MRNKFLVGASVMALAVASCKKNAIPENADATVNAGTSAVQAIATLSGIIPSGTNRVLSADSCYKIDGKVFVDDLASLTIPAGTRLEGVYKADPNFASAIVVTKGGKIFSNGTSLAPVIFTSSLDGLPNGRTFRQPGDWGGIVILGRSTTNKPATQTIEGINQSNPTIPAGIDITYGGSLPNDNSGAVVFTRIEYAGAAIAPNNELNSLTLGGVGLGTNIQNVQCTYGADDAFEFFGGTVRAKFLVAAYQNDDAFDFDFGYTGNIQFAVALRDPAITYSSDPNGIESDNDGQSSGATPTTRPLLSNLTVLGVGNAGTASTLGMLNGALFRRNSGVAFRNSIVAGYPTGVNTSTAFAGSPRQVLSNIIHGFTTAVNPAAGPNPGTSVSNYIWQGGNPNQPYSGTIIAPADGCPCNNNKPLLGNPFPSDICTYFNSSHLAPAKNSLAVIPGTGTVPGLQRSATPTWRAVPNSCAQQRLCVDTSFSGFPSYFIRVGYIGAINNGTRVGNTPNHWLSVSGVNWYEACPDPTEVVCE